MVAEQTRAIGQGPEQVDTVVGARPLAHAIAQAVIPIDFMGKLMLENGLACLQVGVEYPKELQLS